MTAYTGRAQVLIAWATEPFNPSPTWTDVTPWVRLDKGIQLQRGRQDNISDVQQGRATFTADNSDGRFTVGRSTSPYAPDVKIGRRCQVNIPDEHGTLHTRFDGLISELPTAWEGGPGIESLEVMQAADILAWLSRQPPLLSWTQQEALADGPIALWSLADTSNVAQATDQAGQGAAPLQVASQGDGSGAASAGGGVPLTEIQTSDITASVQVTDTATFTTPGSVSWTAPLGTIVSCKVECVGGGKAGTSGSAGFGAAGSTAAEYAAEPSLAITAGLTYTGTVGAGGVPSAGSGGNTTFTGDSVTVTAHASGSGSTNTTHHNGGSGGSALSGSDGGGGGSSGGAYQAGNSGATGGSSAGAGGTAVTGGGGGGAGDVASGGGGGPGSQPGGGGGGGGQGSTAGGAGGAGQITITVTYIPPDASQQNSSLSSWLFTPSATLAARILSGPLPSPVTAAGGFAFECWAGFAALPAAAVTTFTSPGTISPLWTAPPGGTTADVACVAGGHAGSNGGGSSGGTGGKGGEYAEETALAVTPGSSYSGSVGSPGAPSGGAGTNTTFTGDSVTVTANASGSGSSNTVHFNGGNGGGGSNTGSEPGGGGGSSGGMGQAGNGGAFGGSGGLAPTGGGGGGAGDSAGGGGSPGSAPGGGGGGGQGTIASAGGGGGPGQITVTVQPGVSCLLTLVNPRGQYAIAVWVTTAGHLQLASTSGYGTRAPSWTTVDAGQVPAVPFHVAVSVAVTTRVATLYVNGVSAGTVTLPAGASYAWATVGGAYGAWLGGWNGSAAVLGVYPAALSSGRVTAHYTAGTTGFIGSSTGTMISKIAAYVGLPSFYYTAPSGTTDPSYGLTLTSYFDLNGQGPLTAMQAFELAEGGVLSVNAAGQLIFADRASRYAAGAGGSAFVLPAGQYEPDTSFKSNDQYLCTEACFATVDIPGGYPVTNAAAEADFGPYIANSGSIAAPQTAPFADATGTPDVYSTDDLMDAGNYVTGVFGEPVPRVPSLTVDLLTLPASEFSIASFYGLDIGSALELTGLPSQAPDTTGQPLAPYCVMEGINETLDLQTHNAQLYTSPLAQNAAWIPGDALLGVLGTTDTIGRSRAPAALGLPYFPPPTFGATLNRTGSVGAQDMRTMAATIQAKLTPPLLIAEQATAQTLTAAAGQAVTFDTLAADTAGGMGTTTTYTIPAGFAGWWWCAAVVQAATGTASLGGLAAWFAVTLSGVASQWHARSLPYLSTAPYVAVGISGKIGPFSPGDTIQVVTAWSGSNTSTPLGTSDGGSMFTLMWEGYT